MTCCIENPKKILMSCLSHLAQVQSDDQSVSCDVIIEHWLSCDQTLPISDDNDVATSHGGLNKSSLVGPSQYLSYLQQICAQIYLDVGDASMCEMMQHLSDVSQA